MAITFDPGKREWTLVARGLDFADAGDVLIGPRWEFIDDRHHYGEVRIATIGMLNDRMVVIIWTKREDDCHIISMRKANDRERKKYRGRLD